LGLPHLNGLAALGVSGTKPITRMSGEEHG